MPTRKSDRLKNEPPRVAEVIEALQLVPHPEGGYYRETYRAAEGIPRTALPARFRGDRSHGTAIYYLLPAGARSRLHRIAADEVWHFYLGAPLTVVDISPAGAVRETVLGHALQRGEHLQHVVPAGHWFGAYLAGARGYALVGCTVAPGFHFDDLEMADRAVLAAQFPAARLVIEKLT